MRPGWTFVAALPAEGEVVLDPWRSGAGSDGVGDRIAQGFEAQIRPRSGLALHEGVTVLNSPGTIDADYRGEIGVILVNFGTKPFVVRRGARIAQLVVCSGGTGRPDCGRASHCERSGLRWIWIHRALIGGGYEMNLLSRRSVLAIAAVVDVALHSRSAPVAAKAFAARHNLPPRHLETLLQGLVHAKILKGVRGPRGGYELARERRRITVGEIVRTAMLAEHGRSRGSRRELALLERVDRPAREEGGRDLPGQSRRDHRRDHVRDGRAGARARRRKCRGRFRYLA